MIVKRADLFFREGKSDKVYHLQIEKSAVSYYVHFQYGRRGSTLQTGTKIVTPDYDDAEKVFDKIYGEKKAKGYQDMQSGSYTPSPVDLSPSAGEVKEITPLRRRILWDNPAPVRPGPATTPEIDSQTETVLPQLLNIIDDIELESYLKDDRYGAQEKKDGKHLLIKKSEGIIKVFNKKGKQIPCPFAWMSDALKDVEQCVLDGEAIGDTYHCFDILEWEENLRELSYMGRYAKLTNFFLGFVWAAPPSYHGKGKAIRIVPLSTGYESKKALYEQLKKDRKEGIVFKLLGGKFKVGRPNSGGDMLKFKFLAEVSCRVREGRDGKRSVGLELLDENSVWIDMGNVTIPANKDVPPVGTVVEIRYLYVVGKGGHLFQPVYKEPRDDIDESECTIEKQHLKYKAEEEE